MKAFNRIFAMAAAILVLLSVAMNIILVKSNTASDRPHLVEISRLARELEAAGSADLSNCEYVTGIQKEGEDFFSPDGDMVFREINGELYRFDYRVSSSTDRFRHIIAANVILILMLAVIITVMLYLKFSILKPFEQLAAVPYELSKGNLTVPIKETKNHFFGKFLWGVDMLRENMEHQKKRELNLLRERKMLLLSLSHDVKTPLSAIKLYAKALSKGLYANPEKQIEIAENINAKADEIESYLSQIVTASREDFLSFDVNMGEFYLSDLVTKIKGYYTEKLSLIGTDFEVSDYSNCLLRGDLDRSVEVLQNLMENAIKYGDGKHIAIHISTEDDCTLITVRNSGCTLPAADLPHIFESFWRGTNTKTEAGNGLGLYICRQLMSKMNGDIFAEMSDGFLSVTAVFTKT